MKLPPIFLTHPTADQDIPVSSSRRASEIIPQVTYQEVNCLPHNFDPDLILPESLHLYKVVVI